MIIPVYLATEIMGAGVYTAWVLATVYVGALGTAFVLRYANGKWKEIRIIEY